jgi:hypothetical protein
MKKKKRKRKKLKGYGVYRFRTLALASFVGVLGSQALRSVPGFPPLLYWELVLSF